MKTRNHFLDKSGITLIELLIVVSIIGILAIIGIPEINRFSATYKARSCATDLIQNMKVARAMAIKENRKYLITFDTARQRYMIGFSSNDNDLLDLDFDTFGICKDTDSDRLPEGDVLVNLVPECVKVVNLSNCGSNIIFGYGSGTTPPNGPPGTIIIPPSGIGFPGGWVDFNPDGSTNNIQLNADSAYFQHVGRGYSYCVRVSNNAGALKMWKWDGDKDNTGVTTWTELR